MRATGGQGLTQDGERGLPPTRQDDNKTRDGDDGRPDEPRPLEAEQTKTHAHHAEVVIIRDNLWTNWSAGLLPSLETS